MCVLNELIASTWSATGSIAPTLARAAYVKQRIRDAFDRSPRVHHRRGEDDPHLRWKWDGGSTAATQFDRRGQCVATMNDALIPERRLIEREVLHFRCDWLGTVVRGQIESLSTARGFAFDADNKARGGQDMEGKIITPSHGDAIDFLLAWGRGRDSRPSHRGARGTGWCMGFSTTGPCGSTSRCSTVCRRSPLALHQPHNLAAINAVAPRTWPAAGGMLRHRFSPHSSPRFCRCSPSRSYTERGIRRYGFHGLSYEFIASELPRLDPEGRGRTNDRRPPRQRREHVRDGRR